MTIYGCPREEQPALALKMRQLVQVLRIPARIIVCRGGGVGIELTIRGRGKAAERARTAARWSLMDAEAVLQVRQRGVFASACVTCGGTCAHYEHTPEFCAGLVQLAKWWDVELRIVPGMCPECGDTFVYDHRRPRHFPGLCPKCSEKWLLEEEQLDARDKGFAAGSSS